MKYTGVILNIRLIKKSLVIDVYSFLYVVEMQLLENTLQLLIGPDTEKDVTIANIKRFMVNIEEKFLSGDELVLSRLKGQDVFVSAKGAEYFSEASITTLIAENEKLNTLFEDEHTAHCLPIIIEGYAKYYEALLAISKIVNYVVSTTVKDSEDHPTNMETENE